MKNEMIKKMSKIFVLKFFLSECLTPKFFIMCCWQPVNLLSHRVDINESKALLIINNLFIYSNCNYMIHIHLLNFGILYLINFII